MEDLIAVDAATVVAEEVDAASLGAKQNTNCVVGRYAISWIPRTNGM
jgi:hypothetical protein